MFKSKERLQGPAVSGDAVARRAYEKFLSRGSKHGHHLEDWLEAERELREEAGQAAGSFKGARRK
ncbi:MAG: DUF2934 domain-containing protein [Candidatus Omnitrophica bacterium]|nr:DUF2934 domain-containing protein [Candidatus Omnitrophota bacterium]